MTRRGVLAGVLIGHCGPAQLEGSPVVLLKVDIPVESVVYEAHGETFKVREGGKMLPVQYALEVRYKNRIVRITPDELMDALEGK